MKQLSIFLIIILAAFTTFAQPKKKEIEIDKGNRYSKKSNVPINLYYSKAVQMKISNDSDLTYVKWIEYDEYIPSWELSEGDGKKTVYVQYKLASDEESEVFSDDIVLDTQPPTNLSIEFDVDDKKYFTDPSLKIPIYIQAKGAKYMKLSNSKSFYGAKWMIFKEEIEEWELASGEDGPRFVYARFKDVAQNESNTINAKIIVDTQGPFLCAVTINNGDKYTIHQDRNIDLTFTARGADFMKIGTDEKLSDAKWQAFEPNLTYQLDETDGEKTIYAKFKDHAGNESDLVSDKIIQDLTPPKDCQVVIDGGSESTSHLDKIVSLQLTTTDDTKFVMISNTEHFFGAKWQLYTPTTKWKLAGEDDGERTVYVKYKDKAGNVSGIFSDSIVLQRQF
ncbi:MAG: hypothetical protein ACPGJS_08815 [Flammeovirgaceae bacterium]